MPRKLVGKTGIKLKAVRLQDLSTNPYSGKPPLKMNLNNQLQKWPSAVRLVSSFNQMKTMNSVYQQGGHLAPVSCFSSALLVGGGSQQEFEGVKWLGNWEIGGGVLRCTNYRTNLSKLLSMHQRDLMLLSSLENWTCCHISWDSHHIWAYSLLNFPWTISMMMAESWTVPKVFINSTNIYCEHLLCARHCYRSWWYSGLKTVTAYTDGRI